MFSFDSVVQNAIFLKAEEHEIAFFREFSKEKLKTLSERRAALFSLSIHKKAFRGEGKPQKKFLASKRESVKMDFKWSDHCYWGALKSNQLGQLI